MKNFDNCQTIRNAFIRGVVDLKTAPENVTAQLQQMVVSLSFCCNVYFSLLTKISVFFKH